ncbi:MAG TPA: helix-turn-helix transcriptional regulator [Thermoanaerobaculia bacterium]|nr:helix-turn-helix transcriptional regulator [Thermoanaerobaculia bacterium]
MFQWVGETLRRIRKDKGKTLEKLAREAELGRGQLSRIENARQEATFTTLAKILGAQGVSRREYFHRYDLVEAEASAIEQSARQPAAETDAYPSAGGRQWPDEIKEVLAKVESFVDTTFRQTQPVAQGAIEIGDFVVLFRVLPKQQPAPPAPKEAAAPAPVARSSARRRGRRKKR